jgi:hypothetical protein
MATSLGGGTTIISKAVVQAVDQYNAANTPLTEGEIVAALVTLIKNAL